MRVQNAEKLMSVETNKDKHEIEQLVAQLDDLKLSQAHQLIKDKGKKLDKIAFLEDSDEDSFEIANYHNII